MARKRRKDRGDGDTNERQRPPWGCAHPCSLRQPLTVEKLQQEVRALPNAFMWMWQQFALHGWRTSVASVTSPQVTAERAALLLHRGICEREVASGLRVDPIKLWIYTWDKLSPVDLYGFLCNAIRTYHPYVFSMEHDLQFARAAVWLIQYEISSTRRTGIIEPCDDRVCPR